VPVTDPYLEQQTIQVHQEQQVIGRHQNRRIKHGTLGFFSCNGHLGGQTTVADECTTDGFELTGTLRATDTWLLDMTQLLRQKVMRAASNNAKRSQISQTLEGSSKEGRLSLSAQEEKV
jgi:hypothetical protein